MCQFRVNQMPSIAWLFGLVVASLMPISVYSQIQIPSQSLTIPSEPQLQIPTVRSQRNGLSISVRAALLGEFINRDTVENNDVSTRILEADVRGVQTTKTAIRLESKDCPSVARLEIVATGNVVSNTVGYTRQAQITTVGSHTFNVRKPVFFDGNRFSTRPAWPNRQQDGMEGGEPSYAGIKRRCCAPSR